MKKNDVVIEKGMVATLEKTKVTYGSIDPEGSSIIIEVIELDGKKVSRVTGKEDKEGIPLIVRGKLVENSKLNLEAELQFMGFWNNSDPDNDENENYGLYFEGNKVGVAEVHLPK